MALEAIGGASSITSYSSTVKQTENKAPQTQVKQMEETTKKSAQPTQTNMSATAASSEAKNTAKNRQVEESVTSKMKDAIDKVNQKIVPTKTKCEFSYHEDTKRVSIKVIDQETEEVIKEIPPEETLDMLSKIWELAGILVDERR